MLLVQDELEDDRVFATGMLDTVKAEHEERETEIAQVS